MATREKEELERGEAVTPEKLLKKIEKGEEILNSLDDWLEKAEYMTSGKTKEKTERLRAELKKVSGPLSKALDVKKKLWKIGILIFEIQQGSKTVPGGEKGVEAAARIFKALAELGQEIPILGGIAGAYLEFLKLPEAIIQFGKRVREMRIPEKREPGLREAPF